MNSFTNEFMSSEKNMDFLRTNMMGPNALRMAEEMASHLTITPNMRILDLGCGAGLSTMLLARKYGATVFAADLWISPTDNYERFQALGIEGQTVPLSADVTKGLPFAHGYFDIIFTLDAYHYFGGDPQILPALIPLVKKGGCIAVAIPALKYEFGENVPEEMKPFWNSEVDRTMHSLKWWRALWKQAPGIEIVDTFTMATTRQAWREWHTAYHPVIEEDIKMMAAEGGKYFDFIQMIARVI